MPIGHSAGEDSDICGAGLIMAEVAYGLAGQPIAKIRQGLSSRKFSAREMAQELLARIKRFQVYNAFAHVDEARALANAEAADAALAAGNALPLTGIPVSVKDLLNVAGMPTAFGSKLMANNMPSADSACVTLIRGAGANIYGKTTTPEFGHKILTDSPLHGRTANPWSLRHSCGGSSGGAAVAIALGLGPIALTTDGAGSSRIPAGVCGIYGLKPTLGRVPNFPTSDSFNLMVYNGIMARHPEDLGIGLAVMSHSHPSDPWSRFFPPLQQRDAGETSVAGKRFLLIRRYSNRYLDPQVEAALLDCAGKLEAAGAIIEEFDGGNFDWDLDVARRLLRVNQSSRYANALRDHKADLDPSFVRVVEEAGQIEITTVGSDLLARTQLYNRVEALFQRADYLLMPTTAATALPIEQNQFDPLLVDGQPVGSLRDEWYPYTIPYNLTGHPALSMPHGLHSNGLPIGLHVVGRWADENGLIDVACAMDKFTSASSLVPPPLRGEE